MEVTLINVLMEVTRKYTLHAVNNMHRIQLESLYLFIKNMLF